MKLNESYNRQDFVEFLKKFLPDFKLDERQVKGLKANSDIKESFYLGESDDLELKVFEVKHTGGINKRVGLALDGFKIIKNSGAFKALVVFNSEESNQWRLSLMILSPKVDEKGKVSIEASNPKRYSFLLGSDSKLVTPEKYLIKAGKVNDFEDLKKRFSIEVVNKEFYAEISKLYTELVGGELGEGKKKSVFPGILKLASHPQHSIEQQEFAVRFLGRLMFCWFLKEKTGTNGIPLMPLELLSLDAVVSTPDYYHSVLEPIFFEILNRSIESRKEKYQNEPYSSIPYLNGGLFSPHDTDYYDYSQKQAVNHNIVNIPDEWLRKIFEVLNRYNFTVDENTSYDVDLSIDPEMLGRIFENLLAEINPETGESARKSTGSFYTPRPVVEYMIDESLLYYLKEKTKIDYDKIRALITLGLDDDEKYPLNKEEKQSVIDALGTITILDPACGSGAFPIGALQKIVFILQQIDPDGSLWFEKQISFATPEIKRVIEREFKYKNFNYVRKLGIIRQSIFGVDIQPIATEISRLRCFLTLIVDERIDDKEPNRGIEPLPNLDFKFVCANSLIPSPEENGNNELRLISDNFEVNFEQLVTDYFSANDNRIKNEALNKLHNLIDKKVEEKTNYVLKDLGLIKGDKYDTAFREKNIKSHTELLEQAELWKSYKNIFLNKPVGFFDIKYFFPLVKDGFDIVIANPPYLEARSAEFTEKMKKNEQKSAKLRWGMDSEYISRGADLLIYFFELGIYLLSDKGVMVFITQNSWLDTDYGKKFQDFLLKHTNVKAIIDSDFKYFDSSLGPNINTVISIFSGKNIDTNNVITFARYHENFDKVYHSILSNKIKPSLETEIKKIKYVDPNLKTLKWGTILTSSEETLDLISLLKNKGKRFNQLTGLDLSVGQGLNISKALVVESNILQKFPFLKNKLIPFMRTKDGAPFVLRETKGYIIDGTQLNQNEIKILKNSNIEIFNPSSTRIKPILIMPRGISRHYCALNEISAYSSSDVEIYDKNGNISEEMRLNIWFFLNSTVAWLMREITGRKSLGGGLLKSEATDLREMPLYFEFNKINEIKNIYERLEKRMSLQIIEEIDTFEHVKIDEVVFDHLEISQKQRNKIIGLFKKIVSGRSTKATT